MGALQIVLDKGQEDDWFASRMITVLPSSASASLAAFIIRELKTRDPVVHLRVFAIELTAPECS